SVQARQQPAAQLLFQGMVPVADRGLRHPGDQRLRVAEKQLLQRAAAPELFLQNSRLEAISVSGALYDPSVRQRTEGDWPARTITTASDVGVQQAKRCQHDQQPDRLPRGVLST